MARRHRKHRRLGGYVALPGLGAMKVPNPLNFNANGTDVLVGAAAGWAGAQVVQAAANRYLPASIMSVIPQSVFPLVTSAATAAALYYAQGGSKRAEGHALGALAVGAALTVAKALSGMEIPVLGGTFSEVAQVNLGRYGGLLVNDRSDGYNGFGRYGGLLVDDNTNMANDAAMAQMAGLSMGEDDDGMYDLVNVPGA